LRPDILCRCVKFLRGQFRQRLFTFDPPLGIRTNRYGVGMEMVCALPGKAPEFGLMTDEGRKAKWLIDVKT